MVKNDEVFIFLFIRNKKLKTAEGCCCCCLRAKIGGETKNCFVYFATDQGGEEGGFEH